MSLPDFIAVQETKFPNCFSRRLATWSNKSTKSPTESKKEKGATPLGKKLAEKILGIVKGQEKEAEECKKDMEEEYVLGT
jgi:hypothetical protein